MFKKTFKFKKLSAIGITLAVVLGSLSITSISSNTANAAATPSKTSSKTKAAKPAPTKFYVPLESPAARAVPKTKASKAIAAKPQGIWLTGDYWEFQNFKKEVKNAAKQGATPTFVLYNIFMRGWDGKRSYAGSANATQYKYYVNSVSKVIGANKGILIFEPDAIPEITTMSAKDQRIRISLLKYAVSKLTTANKNLEIFVDVGHPEWHPAKTMAKYLKKLALPKNVGFALNVSGFVSNSKNVKYARAINKLLPKSKPYVIDTSRNGGNVKKGEWCNPAGAKLGVTDRVIRSEPNLKYYLWIKNPGTSDGPCGYTYSPAGHWDEGLAKRLLGLMKY